MIKNSKHRKYVRAFLDNGINLVLLSVLTGLFAGVAVTFYNILANIGEDTSAKLYQLIRENPAFFPLLLLGLASGGLVIGTLVRFVPMIRGSGIPQIEGAARGVVRFKWYVTMCSMFAASLACIFLGLSAGAEGPSLQMGGCAGDAGGAAVKRNKMTRRLQIAAGSSAGLAVAFNAPVTGLVFAMEEAFRSFSPQVFISAAISVVVALFTRNAIRLPLGYGVGFTFDTFVFSFSFDGQGFLFCLWTVLAALIVSLAGVGFYYSVFAVKNVFKRITFFKGAGKYIIPFMLAGVFGIVTVYAMGGGHAFIEKLGTNGTGEISIEKIMGISVIASLIIIVIFKFAASVMAMGCGVPCGVFIPMLAIGAGLGAVLFVLFRKAGMPAAYGDYLVIICMSVFFVTVVKAPVTGIVMVFELTGQFENFLPALLGIAVGYLVSMVFRTEPIYEKSLDGFIREEKLYEKSVKVSVTVAVMSYSKAEGAQIRQIIWPTNGLVVKIEREGAIIVPDGETVIRAGDKLTFECETDSREELLDYLYGIVGKPEKEG